MSPPSAQPKSSPAEETAAQQASALPSSAKGKKDRRQPWRVMREAKQLELAEKTSHSKNSSQQEAQTASPQAARQSLRSEEDFSSRSEHREKAAGYVYLRGLGMERLNKEYPPLIPSRATVPPGQTGESSQARYVQVVEIPSVQAVASRQEPIPHPAQQQKNQGKGKMSGKKPWRRKRYEPLSLSEVSAVGMHPEQPEQQSSSEIVVSLMDRTTISGQGRGHSSIIKPTPEYISSLQALVCSPEKLRKNGYVLNLLSEKDLERKKKCGGCGKSMAKYLDNKKPKNGESKGCSEKPGHSPSKDNNLSQKKEMDEQNQKEQKDGDKSEPKQVPLRCRFHPGRPLGNRGNKFWSCCNKRIDADPCGGAEHHRGRHYRPGDIERLWKYHFTPPARAGSSEIRAAVAIDCEMGQAASGDSELIRLTLIDYFSSEILIDSLVYPRVPMEHYRTRFSGVTRRDMEAARIAGTCFLGRDDARKALWKYVGPNTVVVGHSASNDLDSLRWIHPTVIDTYIVESAIQKEIEKQIKKEEEKEKRAQAKAERNGLIASKGLFSDINRDGQNNEQSKPEVGTEASKGLSNPDTPASNPGTKDKQLEELLKKWNTASGGLSLKMLARERLGREIQTAGNKGHDSLEDALATRDLVHWHVVNRREQLM
ncbi:hypothetical protein AJ79_01708 [Helicocarpus griseus UAMH5409]|uniref:Exonuclease domain-containing protein n=1 Tax=Helicocarpus griseus UAMH5409 TaxID=1447875 RepID=A0A2B7Y6U5_9EURO|nr:hypothetical protein AJ79_01708 [Helicocarpus griseus UAMH5409]